MEASISGAHTSRLRWALLVTAAIVVSTLAVSTSPASADVRWDRGDPIGGVNGATNWCEPTSCNGPGFNLNFNSLLPIYQEPGQEGGGVAGGAAELRYKGPLDGSQNVDIRITCINWPVWGWILWVGEINVRESETVPDTYYPWDVYFKCLIGWYHGTVNGQSVSKTHAVEWWVRQKQSSSIYPTDCGSGAPHSGCVWIKDMTREAGDTTPRFNQMVKVTPSTGYRSLDVCKGGAGAGYQAPCEP